MKKYYLFLLSSLIGLIGLSAILLACGVNTDFVSDHSAWAFLGWCAFVIVSSETCRRLADKWDVRPGVSTFMAIVALLALFLGSSIPILFGKVIFGGLGIALLTLICLIRRWMAWLKAV